MQLNWLVGAAVAVFAASAATAENWIMVYDEDPIWMMVDRDSIRTGPDGLVYFRSDGASVADNAADCSTHILYTLKLYDMGGIDHPKWRDEGRPVVAGSAGEATLNYACANR